MTLNEVLKQKNLSIDQVSKDECFKYGQASVLIWLSELMHISTFNASEKAIERLFKKEQL